VERERKNEYIMLS